VVIARWEGEYPPPDAYSDFVQAGL
jgi:hypothetical protein